MVEPSRAYKRALAECTAHHARSKTFSGKFLRPHAPFIKEIIDRLGCQSILDYGCGKGAQYSWVNCEPTGSIPFGQTLESYWGIQVTKYDPAYPPFAAEPKGKFDLVICTHTLGSIPVSDLQWVVDRLYGLANKALYVAEKIGDVGKQVISDREAICPTWGDEQWLAALRRATPIETTFAARHRADSGVVVNRYRL